MLGIETKIFPDDGHGIESCTDDGFYNMQKDARAVEVDR